MNNSQTIVASSPLNHQEQSAFLAFSFTLLTRVEFLLTTVGIRRLFFSLKLFFTTFNLLLSFDGFYIVSILQVLPTYLIFLSAGKTHFPSLTLTIIKQTSILLNQVISSFIIKHQISICENLVVIFLSK